MLFIVQCMGAYRVCCLFYRYRIREELAYENLKDLSLRVQPHDKISAAGTVNIFNSNMDDTLTWDFVAWVRTVTKVPLFVKVRLAWSACIT